MSQSRKSFLRALGIVGAVGLLGGETATGSPSYEKPHTPSSRITSGSRRALRVAHLTDVHVKPTGIAEYGMAAALHAVNSLSDKPDFIINGGDAIMNEGALMKSTLKHQWESFHRILKSDNDLPIFHCIGNHDLYGFTFVSPDHAGGKNWAMEEYQLKKPYYSFRKNGWLFIVLDSVHGKNWLPGYYGKLDEGQMEWLKNELKTSTPDTHICIVSHIPVLGICPLFDGMVKGKIQRTVSSANMHDDAAELVELFFQYPNVRNCISGHIHQIDFVNYHGVDYYCNGAVSGDWWKGSVKHFAPSFSIMNHYEDGSTSREVVYYDWKI